MIAFTVFQLDKIVDGMSFPFWWFWIDWVLSYCNVGMVLIWICYQIASVGVYVHLLLHIYAVVFLHTEGGRTELCIGLVPNKVTFSLLSIKIYSVLSFVLYLKSTLEKLFSEWISQWWPLICSKRIWVHYSGLCQWLFYLSTFRRCLFLPSLLAFDEETTTTAMIVMQPTI